MTQAVIEVLRKTLKENTRKKKRASVLIVNTKDIGRMNVRIGRRKKDAPFFNWVRSNKSRALFH